MKASTALYRGTCGYCVKPIAKGTPIVRIEPRQIRLPGRYGDIYRPRIVSTRFAHESCVLEKENEPTHLDDCGTWANEECDCPVRLTGMEEEEKDDVKNST